MNEGKLIWITGLSGAGKTTIGKQVYSTLKQVHKNVVFIDGDAIREMLGNDLTHSVEDRVKNAYRISKMCEFLVDQNIIVICATMSLFSEIHQYNKKNIDNYYEIFVDVDVSVLIDRDSKQIYSRALKGEINNIIGIDLPYDKPSDPFLTIDNNDLEMSIEEKSKLIIDKVGFV